MLLNIILIIIIILIVIFLSYYIINNIKISEDTLNRFDDEYLANLRFVPEQIFEYNVGDYNDLLQQLEELKLRYEMLNNEYNGLVNERDVYLRLIEDQEENIMNLRAQIDKLKSDIANNANYLFV